MFAKIFMYIGLLVVLSYRMSPNEICKEFMNGVKSMCGTAMMIGFAYVISVILTKGQVLDTIVNFLAGILIYVPKLIQAPLMFMLILSLTYLLHLVLVRRQQLCRFLFL